VFIPQDIAESAMAHITDTTLNGAVGSKLMDAGMSIGGKIIVGEWSASLSGISFGTEESHISARRQFYEIQERLMGILALAIPFGVSVVLSLRMLF
jgi:hypothetical protein